MKLIALTRGLSTLVDDDVYEWASKIKFHAGPTGAGFYAICSRAKKLHRMITNAKKGMSVDHINGDTLDNRKENLRICTHKENLRNQKRRPRKIAGNHKGVYFRSDMKTKPWRAVAWDGAKTIHLGYFATEEEAYEIYKVKAKELYGEFFKE